MKINKILIAFLLIFSPLFVSADEGWQILDFHSDIVIKEDGRVDIEETIQVDFGDLQKHGIFRDLPYVYETTEGEKVYTDVDVLDVRMNGNSIPFKTINNKSNIRLKIGDPEETISGEHTYSISYQVAGVLKSFEDYDELYWNITGDEWDVPIKNAAAKVTLLNGSIVQQHCFQGVRGATDGCSSEIHGDSSVSFSATRDLLPREGVTAAVGFTKGAVPILSVDRPRTVESMLTETTTIVSFLLTLVIGSLTLIFYWWKNGRDAWWLRKSLHDPDAREQLKPLWSRETVVVEYDPPGSLRPAEIGTLIDDTADTLDISATIVDLAVRGYLLIEEVPKKWILGSKDYLFKKTEKKAGELLNYEHTLLTSMFDGEPEIHLSDLKNSFYKDLAKVKKQVYVEVTGKKLFADNPDRVRTKYIGIAVGIIVLGGLVSVLGGFFLFSILLGLGGAVAIVGIEAMFFSQVMPRRTAHGREMLRKVRGYKVFLSGTEKYRQPFFERENIFMEVLPYAIVFGVTTKLAKAFEEMGIQPSNPAWYHGTAPFNALAFSEDIQGLSDTLSTNMASSPSSSGSGGGGFSGGGFGGGGGGSW